MPAVRITSYLNGITGDPDVIKQDLKLYGPLVAAIQTDNDWAAAAGSLSRRPCRAGHRLPGRPQRPWAGATGSARTVGAPRGAMQVTAILLQHAGATAAASTPSTRRPMPWARRRRPRGRVAGGSSLAGNWSAGDSTCWSAGGSPYAWANQDGRGLRPRRRGQPGRRQRPGLRLPSTFNPDARPATRSGGAMTIDHGGIAANESVEIDSPVTIGAPQQWVTAAGAMLTVDGGVHTVNARLTITGADDGDQREHRRRRRDQRPGRYRRRAGEGGPER